MAFTNLMTIILPGSPVSPDSDFFRSDGTVHGAVDFNYVNGGLNTFGGPQVFSPVGGRVVSVNGDLGAVIIQRYSDNTFHRILHLDSTTIAVNSDILVGDPIGRMGGRGEYLRRESDGARVNYVPQVVTSGQRYGADAYTPHVHYEIYYPDASGWSPYDLRIDPKQYWDLDPNGGLKVTTFSTNVSLTEGGTGAEVTVNVNTPHWAARERANGILTLRVTISSNVLPGAVQIIGSNRTSFTPTGANVDPTNPNVYYLTLPPSESVFKKNDAATFLVVASKDTDLNPITGSLRVEAGYLKADGTWVSYQDFQPIDNIAFEATDPDFDPNFYLNYADAAETQSTWFSSTPHTVIDARGETGLLRIAAVGDYGEVYGGDSSNILYGNEFANYLHNGEGNDELYGYAGDDFLVATGGPTCSLAGRTTTIYTAGWKPTSLPAKPVRTNANASAQAYLRQ